jgi:hypothetical protein
MSQQNFQFGKTKSMESSTILQLLIVIILLSLGWNSLQFQYHLCYKLQPYGNFSTTGPKENLNSLAQVDIFLKYFQLLLSFSYISCWTTAIFRHKPPWLLNTHVYLRNFTKKEGIDCQFTTTVKLALTYSLLSRVTGPLSWNFFWNYTPHNNIQLIAKFQKFRRTIQTDNMFTPTGYDNKRRFNDIFGSSEPSEDQHNTFSDVQSYSLAQLQDCCNQLTTMSTPFPELIHRQITRAEASPTKLPSDMMKVLCSLHERCTRHGLTIQDYVDAEDAGLLTHTDHG